MSVTILVRKKGNSVDKSLIIKCVLSFGVGLLASLFLSSRTPTIVEKTVEISSIEDIAKIEKLQQDILLEKQAVSMLRSELSRASISRVNESKNIEETVTVIKPDGTKIIREKKDKTVTKSESSSSESVNNTAVSVVKETKVEKIQTETTEIVHKEEKKIETEYQFTSSASFGLGTNFDFEKSSFSYDIVSTYQFSKLFGVFAHLTIQAPYPTKVESIGFGFTINL